ncbi:conserved hypothetical protein [Stigmatella aurantiaca DW4/3-1]|uniref:Uncharacterized protein n=1 Tax=Stigmatella aurantiaca (strain DW4/3-1) TaxID=378806 RepID=Q096W1_STIAD|nr:conserved hypothetical protein [Stigmatella aurantiaca DW4/3-1]
MTEELFNLPGGSGSRIHPGQLGRRIIEEGEVQRIERQPLAGLGAQVVQLGDDDGIAEARASAMHGTRGVTDVDAHRGALHALGLRRWLLLQIGADELSVRGQVIDDHPRIGDDEVVHLVEAACRLEAHHLRGVRDTPGHGLQSPDIRLDDFFRERILHIEVAGTPRRQLEGGKLLGLEGERQIRQQVVRELRLPCVLQASSRLRGLCGARLSEPAQHLLTLGLLHQSAYPPLRRQERNQGGAGGGGERCILRLQRPLVEALERAVSLLRLSPGAGANLLHQLRQRGGWRNSAGALTRFRHLSAQHHAPVPIVIRPQPQEHLVGHVQIPAFLKHILHVAPCPLGEELRDGHAGAGRRTALPRVGRPGKNLERWLGPWGGREDIRDLHHASKLDEGPLQHRPGPRRKLTSTVCALHTPQQGLELFQRLAGPRIQCLGELARPAFVGAERAQQVRIRQRVHAHLVQLSAQRRQRGERQVQLPGSQQAQRPAHHAGGPRGTLLEGVQPAAQLRDPGSQHAQGLRGAAPHRAGRSAERGFTARSAAPARAC